MNTNTDLEPIDLTDLYKAIGTVKRAIADSVAEEIVESFENLPSLYDVLDAAFHSSSYADGKEYEIPDMNAVLERVLSSVAFEDLKLCYALEQCTAAEMPVAWDRLKERIQQALDRAADAATWQQVRITRFDKPFVAYESLPHIVPPYPAVACFQGDEYACWMPDPEMMAGGETDFDPADVIVGYHIQP